VAALVASSESRRAVEGWLRAASVSDYDVALTEDWIAVRTNVATVERLLEVRLARFHHAASNQRVVRATNAYSVPESLAQHIRIVGGTHRFHRTDAPLLDTDLEPIG
jgi:hypothetical protein